MVVLINANVMLVNRFRLKNSRRLFRSTVQREPSLLVVAIEGQAALHRDLKKALVTPGIAPKGRASTTGKKVSPTSAFRRPCGLHHSIVFSVAALTAEKYGSKASRVLLGKVIRISHPI